MSKPRKPAAPGFRVPALVRHSANYKARVENSLPSAILNCIVTTVVEEAQASPCQSVVYVSALRDLTVAVDDHFRDLPWQTRKLLLDAVDGIVHFAVKKNGVTMCSTSLVMGCLYWLAPIVEDAARSRAIMNAGFIRAFHKLMQQMEASKDYEQAKDEGAWIAEVIRVRMESLGLFSAAQPVKEAA